MTTATDSMIRTHADEVAVREGCYFDEDEAQRVVDFFAQFLRHSKGRWAGQPFILAPWQRDDCVRPLFGWMRPDGTRRFRQAYWEVAKKNGKSTLAAGCAVYLLCGDAEPGAEIYCAATTREQAGIVYREAAAMIESSPDLSRRCIITRSQKHVGFPSTHSFLKAISSDVGGAEGPNIHGLIFDEFHALKKRAFWDALSFGGKARLQPLAIVITTAGFDRTSVCWETHEYARQILDGSIDDITFHACIYAAREDEDWTTPEAWHRANPNLGVTMTLDEFVADCKEAQTSAQKENRFKRYRLNLWTEQMTKWLNAEHWRACGWEIADPVAWRAETLASLAGQQCTAGLDLGSTSDLTALALWFESADDEPSILVPWFWLPEDGAWRDDTHRRELYAAWIKQGFITPTPGNVCDYARVRKDANAIADEFGIVDLAVDRLFQGAQLCTELGEDGFNVIAFGQGFLSMAAPSKQFEERVLGHQLAHGNNPVLNWMAANVAVLSDPAGNIKPVKPKRNSAFKIDGIVAAIMALGRAMAQQGPSGSVYDTRGIIHL